MRKRDIGIKYKVFSAFLLFAIVLLGVLWFFQIIYLKDFYRSVKKVETEKVLNTLEGLILSGNDVSEDIENLAGTNNMAIYVTDEDGRGIYNAEYIHNSRLSSMPLTMFLECKEKASEAGGTAVIEFEGSKRKLPQEAVGELPGDVPDVGEQPFISESRIEYTLDPNRKDLFRQNIGDDLAESIIYVRTLSVNNTNYVLMVNSVLTPLDATVSTLKRQLLIISTIMLVVSLCFGFGVSYMISRSIIKLDAGAKRLAAGDYDVKFDSVDYAEVARLSDTLNYAASELKKTDDLQKELIANVSHDLRTPLTMIKGFSEMMRDIPGENNPENCQVVIAETERLTGLVNDMLDISKLKAKTIELEPARYNLTQSIKTVLTRYNKLQEVDGYTVDFSYDRDIYVFADEQKMYQVIYNLVNNAINYTGDDKKVYVSQIINNDIVRIEVTDTGEGVSQEDIPFVWDRYYKNSSVHKRAKQGSGLGLSIVKSVLEMHGAKYGVNSVPNEGATFWFEIPISE